MNPVLLTLYSSGVEFCERLGLPLSWLRVWGLGLDGLPSFFNGTQWILPSPFDSELALPICLHFNDQSITRSRAWILTPTQDDFTEKLSMYRGQNDNRALVFAAAGELGHEWSFGYSEISRTGNRHFQKCKHCGKKYELPKGPKLYDPCGFYIEPMVDRTDNMTLPMHRLFKSHEEAHDPSVSEAPSWIWGSR